MSVAKIKAAIRALPYGRRHSLIHSILSSEADEEARRVKKWLRSLTPKFDKQTLKAMEEAHARSEAGCSTPSSA